MGVYQNKPKVFMDERGEADGLFVNLFDEIARAEGWTPLYVPCQWTECLDELEAGRIDLMPDVAHSRERARRFAFHKTPVLESWSQIYASPGASIQTMADLDGKRVALLGGSIQQTTFGQMMAGFGFETTLIPTDSLEDAFRAVQKGEADAAIANHFFGEYFHEEYGLVRTSVVFHVAQLYFVTAKGRNRDLLDAIDRRLDQWRAESNSAYYATLGRWMDRPPVSVVPRRVIWVVGISLALLLLAVCAILLLRHQVRSRTRHLVRVNEELHETQAALLKSESLLNSVERLSRVGGWEWDVEKQTVSWTDETWRIHGLERVGSSDASRELLDRSLACFDPAAQPRVREALQRCEELGEPFDLEGGFTSAAGKRLWVRTTAVPIRGESGKVDRVVGNIMDVTTRKAADQERRHLEDQLRQSMKMDAIGKLAGGVAHDFNNQLTVILNYADMALLHVTDERVRRLLTEVVNAGQRSAALTRQLLAFSRKQALELKPVDVNQCASNLEKMLRRVLGEDVHLRLDLAPDLGLTLADAGQIDQVLMNLVINARDAMPTGGTLTIETSNAELDPSQGERQVDVAPGPYVMLSVTDTGVGMDEDTRARIFEPFFTTKPAGKGTGLGLSIVYGIVRQCGGHIHVRSEPGRGACFQILLPRELTAVVAASEVTAPPAQVGGSETILVVEDDAAVRELTAEVLRAAGYNVLVAASGDEAQPAAEAHDGDIHLLLTDVVLPGLGGTALAAHLTEARPGIKVLFMSGYSDMTVIHDAVAADAVRLIPKPFTVTQLAQTVRATLDGG
ncbi:MAG: hypothetical protein AMXMBFR64_20040 [Myxococcales bacterium]